MRSLWSFIGRDGLMSVSVNIHEAHRQYTDGLEVVVVTGDTVGACLKALVDQYPPMQDVLFSKAGELNHQIEIYLNMESAYPDELKKEVSPNDDIHITVMMMGRNHKSL